MFLSIIMPVSRSIDIVTRAVDSIYCAAGYSGLNVEIVLAGERCAVAEWSARAQTSCAADLAVAATSVSVTAAQARNAALAIARGSHCLFLDDDDELLPHALSVIEEAIRRERAALSKVLMFSGYEMLHNGHLAPSRSEVMSCCKHAAIRRGIGSGFVIPENAFRIVGGFDESFAVIEDTELMVRLLASGLDFEFLPSEGVRVHLDGEDRLSRPGNLEVRIAELSKLLTKESMFCPNQDFVREHLEWFLSILKMRRCVQ